MASAGNLIAVLLFWVIIGITWAVLTENVIDKLPSMFPLSVAEQAATWELLYFIWRISIVILGFGTAISILGNRGTPGVVASATIILIGMFLIIFTWAAFYEVINITIPATFSSAFGTATNEREYVAVYNTSLVLFMLGLALLSFLLSGSIGRARRREYILSGNNRDTTINRGVYEGAGEATKHFRSFKARSEYNWDLYNARKVPRGDIGYAQVNAYKEKQASNTYREKIRQINKSAPLKSFGGERPPKKK